ncbi:MAG: hypothetical protein ABJL44_19260 [Algibacter sp.]
MTIPKTIKTILLIFLIWTLVAGLLITEILKDDGLFAQIAIPFFFGIIHLAITIIAVSQIYFTYKLSINKELKVIFGILLAIPIGIAFWKIPLLNTIF